MRKPCEICKNPACTNLLCQAYRCWFSVEWDNMCERAAAERGLDINELRKIGAEKHRAYIERENAKRGVPNG